MISEIINWVAKWVHYLICFTVFGFSFTSFGYFMWFCSNLGLNGRIDSSDTVIGGFLWDLGLLLLFICQHSLMATAWFKKQLKSWSGISVSERLVYLVATSACLMTVVWHWHSVPHPHLWMIDTSHRGVLWCLFTVVHAVLWVLFMLIVIIMDAGELFGIAQVYNYHNGLPQPLTKKCDAGRRLLYSRMRHPGPVILSLLLWLHPMMTLDRVLVASVLTAYMCWRHVVSYSEYQMVKKHVTSSHHVRFSSTSTSYKYESVQ